MLPGNFTLLGMKRWILCFVLLCLASIAEAQLASSVLVIDDVTVIDVKSGTPQPHRSVIVHGNRILAVVGPEEQERTHRIQATVIDGKGRFLIPGLWDMHVHMVFGDWFPRGKEITVPLFIANGITGVRDMGGELDVLGQWRKDITAGRMIGPRIVMSGPMLD